MNSPPFKIQHYVAGTPVYVWEAPKTKTGKPPLKLPFKFGQEKSSFNIYDKRFQAQPSSTLFFKYTETGFELEVRPVVRSDFALSVSLLKDTLPLLQPFFSPFLIWGYRINEILKKCLPRESGATCYNKLKEWKAFLDLKRQSIGDMNLPDQFIELLTIKRIDDACKLIIAEHEEFIETTQCKELQLLHRMQFLYDSFLCTSEQPVDKMELYRQLKCLIDFIKDERKIHVTQLLPPFNAMHEKSIETYLAISKNLSDNAGWFFILYQECVARVTGRHTISFSASSLKLYESLITHDPNSIFYSWAQADFVLNAVKGIFDVITQHFLPIESGILETRSKLIADFPVLCKPRIFRISSFLEKMTFEGKLKKALLQILSKIQTIQGAAKKNFFVNYSEKALVQFLNDMERMTFKKVAPEYLMVRFKYEIANLDQLTGNLATFKKQILDLFESEFRDISLEELEGNKDLIIKMIKEFHQQASIPLLETIQFFFGLAFLSGDFRFDLSEETFTDPHHTTCDVVANF